MIQNNVVLFDDHNRENLLPLTYTRPVAELRVGITTIKEKWELISGRKCSYQTVDYLSEKYPAHIEKENVFINSAIIPNEELVRAILKLKHGEVLKQEDRIIAYTGSELLPSETIPERNELKIIECKVDFLGISNTWDIFSLNEEVLCDDFQRITRGRKSQSISKTNNVLASHQIFIEEGAKVEFSTLNADTGPIYIGRNAEVMEGVIIRGPHALCEHATLKMGARIYTGTTVGPHCKVGGEVHSTVFTGYSSKAHDGFLGNAVIGEWCNLGADSNNSNLKNNYAEVKLWNYPRNRFVDTGLQFCGLIMGDHSKCGINTMFNTGTVVGVSANIFGAGFPRNFVPSFSWGGAAGFTNYRTPKALETAKIAMSRRKLELTQTDQDILCHIYDISAKYRKF